MKTQLVLINRPSRRPWNVDGPHLLWETCIRQVLLTKPEHASQIETQSDDLIFSDVQAYQYFLEVICGLHSPVVGETEVFGQFKEFFDKVWNSDADPMLKQFVYELNRDAREVRRTHLKDIGGTSYGSLVRKQVKEYSEVHILGSGQLAREILPWLVKTKKQVFIHSRNEARLMELKPLFPSVTMMTLKDETPMTGALIIAAPVKSAELNSWLGTRHPQVILDLRGESVEDPVIRGIPVQGLHEFFAQIDNNRKKIEAVVIAAKKQIEELSQRHAIKNTYRI